MSIDFLSRLTSQQKKNIIAREADEKRRTVGQVTAIDTEGNEFIKTVMLTKEYKVIDFGWPISYYLEELYGLLKKSNSPYLVIDMAGLNHKGYKVTIPIKNALDILEKGIELKKKLLEEDERKDI